MCDFNNLTLKKISIRQFFRNLPSETLRNTCKAILGLPVTPVKVIQDY